MGLFKKKGKTKRTTKESAHLNGAQVEGEMISLDVGLELDEIERLLELLGRDNESRLVLRRKVGSILDAAKGQVLWLKPYRLNLKEAQELVHSLIEQRKEKRLEEIKRRQQKYPNYASPEEISPEQIEYPQKLSPDDILRSIESAKQRLEDSPKPQKTVSSTRIHAEQIFHVMNLLKQEEATRFARKIAALQSKHLNRTPEEEVAIQAEKKAKMLEEAEEKIEKIRTLKGFGKHLHTLVDDIGDVVANDVDNATKVVKQWIGTQNENRGD